MKKILFVFTFLFFLILVGCNNFNKEPDIEGYLEDIDGYLEAKWGMSKKEIKQLIKLPLTDELDNILMFSDVIEEDNVTRLYMFDKLDRLFGVMIVFEVPNQDENLFRNKFIKTYNNLAFIYGDADEYIDEELDKRGLSAFWKFKKSGIFLQMQIKKPFNKLALALLYMNKDYAEQFFKSKPLDKF